MRLAVDAAGETADDDETRGGELAAEAARDLAAVGRAGTRADDRDGRPREQLDVGVAAQEEPRRRVVDRPSSGGNAGSERARKRNPSPSSRASSAPAVEAAP